MSVFGETQEILHRRADYEARLKLLPYDGTPEINLKSFIKSSEEYSYPYPASANTAEWQTYEADCLKKAFSLDVPVADACTDLAGQMNEVLAAE